MYFEGRKLTSYSQPVSPDKLVVGKVYYLLGFMDHKAVLFEAYQFIGRNLETEDQDRLYFQTYASYKQGLRWSTSSTDDDMREFLCQPQDELGMIFEFEHALNELLKFSLRKGTSGGRA